jgi:hypothetical protein
MIALTEGAHRDTARGTTLYPAVVNRLLLWSDLFFSQPFGLQRANLVMKAAGSGFRVCRPYALSAEINVVGKLIPGSNEENFREPKALLGVLKHIFHAQRSTRN